jgi:hypothetical protein
MLHNKINLGMIHSRCLLRAEAHRVILCAFNIQWYSISFVLFYIISNSFLIPWASQLSSQGPIHSNLLYHKNVFLVFPHHQNWIQYFLNTIFSKFDSQFSCMIRHLDRWYIFLNRLIHVPIIISNSHIPRDSNYYGPEQFCQSWEVPRFLAPHRSVV